MRAFLLSAIRVIAVCGCLTMAATPRIAIAQGAGIEKKEERKEPQWIPAYFLTALGIGLGLLCVCRPTFRKNPDGEKDDSPA